MVKVLTTILTVLVALPALVYGGICGYFYSKQEEYLFYAQKLQKNFEFQFDGNFEEINISVDKDIVINSLLFRVKKPKGIIFYQHGNAGSLAGWGQIAGYYNSLGYDFFIFDYRGFGKSDGEIENQKMLLSDSMIIYNYIKNMYSEDKIILYGRSIGTAPSIYIASEMKPKLLILHTPFDSMKKVAEHHLSYLPLWIMKYKLNTTDWAKKVTCPVWIIHGTMDSIIPLERAMELKDKFTNLKEFVIVEGGTHNNLMEFEEYSKFITEILK